MIVCPSCGGVPPSPGRQGTDRRSCPCGLLSLVVRDLGGDLFRTVMIARSPGCGVVHVGDGTLGGEPELRLFGPDGNVMRDPPADMEAWVRGFGPWALASQVLGS